MTAELETTVHGRVAPGFEGVRDVFVANFAERGDLGAAVSVYHHGEEVVGLWGGVAERSTGRPYGEDTLQLVFSTSKGVVAVCVGLLIERGQLDPDAPVAEYWPEFAAGGKAGIPVSSLLCHEAGLPVLEGHLDLDELLAWDPVVEMLAAQTPLWEPGTAHGYHALTFGWLVGELIRRISGRTVGTFLADEVSGPLGLDLLIGLPEAQESRVAPLTMSFDSLATMDPEELAQLAARFAPDSLGFRAVFLDGSFGVFSEENSLLNSRELRAAEVPAANAVTTADSLGRLYAATIGEIDGVRLLAPSTVDALRTPRNLGPDLVLGGDTSFGLGMMCHNDYTPFLGPGSFGHYGAGGSVAFADPASGTAFAYVMNKMQMDLNGDDRSLLLIHAVRDAIG